MSVPRQYIVRFISLADQVVFSAATFLLMIMLARYYSEVELAGYGIGLSIALTLQGVLRNCYVIQNSIILPRILRNLTSKVLGQQTFIWGILLIVELAVLTMVLFFNGNSFYGAIVISTIACSLIYAQLDFDRIMLIKHEKYWSSFIASALYLTLNIILFFAIPQYNISFYMVMLILGVYAFLKFICLLFALGLPNLFWGWRLIKRDFKKHFISSISGSMGYFGHNHMPLIFLGFFEAPIQTAAFVAMRGLMQPLLVIVRSLDIIDKNLFQLITADNDDKVAGMREVLIRQILIYGLLAFGVILFVTAFGDTIIQLVYGAKYAAYSHILTGWALVYFILAISFPLETMIVKLDKLKTYNFYRLAAGAIGAILAVFLCGPYGALGAVIACFVGFLVSIVCALWVVRDVLFWKNNELALNTVN